MPPQQPISANFLASLMPLILMMLIFYFMLIRPQQKARRAHEEMLKNLQKNDAVVTNGGIYGTVVNVKEKSAVLKVDDNTKIEVEKSAIARLRKADA